MKDLKNEKKQELDKAILKAYITKLQREVASYPGFSGIKIALSLAARDLANPDVGIDTLRTIQGKAEEFERQIHERKRREEIKRNQDKSSLERTADALTGNMEM